MNSTTTATPATKPTWFQNLEAAAAHAELDVISFIKGIAHFVAFSAPIAELVGTAIGNPEVAAAAGIAERVANAVDKSANTQSI